MGNGQGLAGFRAVMTAMERRRHLGCGERNANAADDQQPLFVGRLG
mgnify:CR=1 FL=1